MTVTRRDLLMGLGGIAIGAAATRAVMPGPHAGKEKPAARPNVIVLIADDMRWDLMGVAGHRIIQTPNLDRLATVNGTLYNNAFVTTSVCPTSRASIMLGQKASTHGIWGFNTPFTASQMARTYHQRLKSEGYRTGFIGKWGVGDVPGQARFDYFDGFQNLGHYYPAEKRDQHLTDYHADSAIRFLKESAEPTPYCLTVSFWAPHAQSNQAADEMPFDAELAHVYSNMDIPVPPHYSSIFADGLPPFMDEQWSRTMFERRHTDAEKNQRFTKGYYRLITGMDRAIGRILDALEQRGDLDNTLIVFLSDNGFLLGEHGLTGKWLMFEESIRIPMIVKYPRNSESGDRCAQGIRSHPVLNIDVAPTILTACGIHQPPEMEGVALQAFEGGRETQSGTPPRAHFTYEYKLDPFFCLGVRTDRWKLAWYAKAGRTFLYNLLDDPYEQHDRFDDPSVAPVREHLWQTLQDEFQGSRLWDEAQISRNGNTR
ncbi:sulfatase-like hydrolase/transferase [Magnetovibrio sp.]|uniref:sulfatase-like hydrolase/transferase n=1 Tax=Magnetovibrio sp. TaxID=2024836 RepID=UPI002F939C06